MTRAALFPDPVRLSASAALAAVGINRLAVIAETDPGGPLHQLGRAARTELGLPESVPPVALAAAVIGLGAIPRGQTKEERQIARALMAFRALLRAWDRYDQGRIAQLQAQLDAHMLARGGAPTQRPRGASGLPPLVALPGPIRR